MNWEESDKFTRIADIGVDAGMVWIGDPCYIIGNQDGLSPDALSSWDTFCDWACERDNTRAFRNLGVVASSGYGDGLYPVYARMTKDGRVAELRVVFVPED